jgi:leucyl-tRNA synthetase
VGADALRLFHLFVGPPADDVDWSDQTDEVIDGCASFLSRLWRLAAGELSIEFVERDPTPVDIDIQRATHRLIARVTDEFASWSYNTAVASVREFTNVLYRYVQSPEGARRATLDEAVDTLLKLMAPMTPHVTAELWERRHTDAELHAQPWPVANPSLVAADRVTMVVQVNGKVRDRIDVDPGIDEAEAERLALSLPRVVAHLGEGAPRKVISRPPKLVNIVT